VSGAIIAPHGATFKRINLVARVLPRDAMAKKRLTDRTLKALKPKRQRYELMDTDVPGFGVRVSEAGQRTFILIARYPGSPNPTRRAIGEYPAISLEKARRRARDWRDLIEKGVDPKVHEARLRREEIRKQQTTFGAVAEDFLERHVSSQRRASDTAREIRKELIGPWGERPIAGITREDVVILVEAIARRPAPYLAHVVLGHIRSLFNWAINRGTYGLETSPCDRLKPGALIGAKQPRQRILSDTEIAALWRASEAIGYPYGPLYRMLLLTGARKSEASDARWSEFDLKKKIWTVPAERFKSNATHLVPLSDQAMAVLESIPRFTKGDHLFSANFGDKPVGGFSKAKARLDKLMGAPPWVIHDIRRTVRTRLASLRVPDMVAEMVIGHGRRGLQRVYDQHTYEAEMREALERWAARLRDIVTPPPDNLVRLKKETA
jgi:integrase